MSYKNCPWLDLNPCPFVLEATATPTVLQPLHNLVDIKFGRIFVKINKVLTFILWVHGPLLSKINLEMLGPVG